MDPQRWDPEGYGDFIRAEIPAYDRLQDELASASRAPVVDSILDLGTGTGETALRVLDEHPEARLVGTDESSQMLTAAGRALAGRGASFELRRLEDPLPLGPFDLIVSALAVHHLDGKGKADLFKRVSGALRPGGRFVLADIVLGEATPPGEPPYDRPNSIDDQLDWLEGAGLGASMAWREGYLAVLVGDRPSA